LNELIDWAMGAPDEIFEKNNRTDIYSNVAPELGPWESITHRKAVMLEVLRVLGGFESSWNWNAGVDTTNPNSNTPCTEEAGIFQCSGDSMAFDAQLKNMLHQAAGDDSCESFINTTKSNHKFAIEYCARLIRFTVNHHGPIKEKKINPWLRRDAVSEFMGFLAKNAFHDAARVLGSQVHGLPRRSLVMRARNHGLTQPSSRPPPAGFRPLPSAAQGKRYARFSGSSSEHANFGIETKQDDAATLRQVSRCDSGFRRSAHQADHQAREVAECVGAFAIEQALCSARKCL
jgi:hypothetical protein